MKFLPAVSVFLLIGKCSKIIKSVFYLKLWLIYQCMRVKQCANVCVCVCVCAVSSSVCVDITVRGTEGEQVTIKCPYDKGYENSYKYFLKGLFKDNNVILKSDGGASSVSDDRFSLRDDHQSKSFTVTIRNLRMDDAGAYGCRAGYQHYKEIQINVVKGA